MLDTSAFTEHQEVVGSDGEHVGTVDKVDSGKLKLTKSDPASGGEHRFVPFDAIAGVKDGKVVLTVPAAQARDFGNAPGRS